MKDEVLEVQAMAYGETWDEAQPSWVYTGALAARDGFIAGYRAAAGWTRIIDEDISLPSPGKLVLLAWEKDPDHDGKPYVDRKVYVLTRPYPKSSDKWFWRTVDEGNISQDDLLPSHWMYFPDPPIPEGIP